MTASTNLFRLYANCFPVRGARRSLVCDLQKGHAQFIPNDLYEILTEMRDLTLSQIKAQYDNEQDQTLEMYFDLLVDQEYGFWCDEPERFPDLDLSWDRPEAVTNAIVDVDKNSSHDFASIFDQLDELGCQALQVRAYDELPLTELERVLEAAAPTRFRHMDLVLKFHPELTGDRLLELACRYQVISRIVVHSSPAPAKPDAGRMPVVIRFHKEALTAESCGEVAPAYFSITTEHFTEGLLFNTCLNRKISVSVDGEIKGCPAMGHSCGNISQVRLEEAMRNPALVQIGSITKDQIAVCRDCEFRYICTDCRAFTASPGDLYSKPAKCSYDPYTATWT